MVYYSRLRRQLAALGAISKTLLEPVCAICAQPCTAAAGLCAECQDIVKYQEVIASRHCPGCALELSAGTSLACGECCADPPPFTRTIAALRYGPTARLLVNQLKHRQRLSCLPPMVDLMVRAIEGHGLSPTRRVDLLAPVPLPTRRLLARGFNQAHELAKPLGRRFGIPVDGRCCKVLGDYSPSQQLGARQRRAMLRQRFVAHDRVAGKHIAIVDDVVTTTSTARAIGQALIDAGASGCELWCFARTPKDR